MVPCRHLLQAARTKHESRASLEGKNWKFSNRNFNLEVEIVLKLLLNRQERQSPCLGNEQPAGQDHPMHLDHSDRLLLGRIEASRAIPAAQSWVSFATDRRLHVN